MADQHPKQPLVMMVVAYQAGDPKFTFPVGPNREMTKDVGYSIAQVRKMLGGEEGYITDPFGEKHYLSLRQWAHRGPKTTRVLIKFRTPDTLETDPTVIEEFRRRLESGDHFEPPGP